MFSPFPDSKLTSFTEQDLESLCSMRVAEGLFVEYKSELVTPARVANSIASFGNSYGAWYVVGMDADKVANCATAVTGISLERSRDPVATIRSAVKEYLQPTPTFFTELIHLSNGNVAIVVSVPEAQDKPIISKDGRIYRRIGDASEPTPEKDRSAIDRLIDEGRDKAKRFSDFCTDDRAYCKAEGALPWLHVYVKPSPDWVTTNPHLTREDLANLLKRLREPVTIFESDGNVVTSKISYDVIRCGPECAQVSLHSLAGHNFNDLTLELFTWGWARLRIPLEVEHLGSFLDGPSFFRCADCEELLTLLQSGQNDNAVILDVARSMSAIVTAVGAYTAWLGDTPDGTEFQYRLELSNVWRLFPFLDDPAWCTFIRECGMQLEPRETIFVPMIRGSFGRLDAHSETQFGVAIAMESMLALGLPYDVALLGFASHVLETTGTQSD